MVPKQIYALGGWVAWVDRSPFAHQLPVSGTRISTGASSRLREGGIAAGLTASRGDAASCTGAAALTSHKGD